MLHNRKLSCCGGIGQALGGCVCVPPSNCCLAVSYLGLILSTRTPLHSGGRHASHGLREEQPGSQRALLAHHRRVARLSEAEKLQIVASAKMSRSASDGTYIYVPERDIKRNMSHPPANCESCKGCTSTLEVWGQDHSIGAVDYNLRPGKIFKPPTGRSSTWIFRRVVASH